MLQTTIANWCNFMQRLNPLPSALTLHIANCHIVSVPKKHLNWLYIFYLGFIVSIVEGKECILSLQNKTKTSLILKARRGEEKICNSLLLWKFCVYDDRHKRNIRRIINLKKSVTLSCRHKIQQIRNIFSLAIESFKCYQKERWMHRRLIRIWWM